MTENFRTVRVDSFTKVNVPEESVAKFCGPCQRLGENNVCNGCCNNNRWQSIIAYVDSGECVWAKVDGKLGKLTKRGFAENDWLTPILSQMEKDITPEIKAFVDSATPEMILNSKKNYEELYEQTKNYFSKKGYSDVDNQVICSLYNNWRCNLPEHPFYSSGNYRDLFKNEGKDVKYGDLATSQIKKSQTPRQFFATVDVCILKEGLNIEEIIRMNTNDQTLSDTIRINKYTLPVLIRLRALGYAWHDLTG